MPDDTHDAREIRCPQLGGPVTFGYCRKMNDDLPCRNLLGCWSGRFDVVAFLRATYTVDELKRAFAPRDKTRFQRLIELAERAKQGDESQPGSEPERT